jgi:CHAT domain-containing protein
MKKIFTLLVLLLPVMVFGQSRQSNKLYNQGMELFKAERYEEAIPYFQKSDSLDKKKLKPKSTNYYRAELKLAKCWRNIAVHKEFEGKYSEAIKFTTMASETFKKILGEENRDYAVSLNYLAIYNGRIGNYTEGIRFGILAMEIFKKIFGEENLDYAMTLNNLAINNYCIGNYTEAIRLETIVVDIEKKISGGEHPEYANAIECLAIFNVAIGNNTEAIRLGTIAMEINKKVFGEDDPNYANSLSNLSVSNSFIGNYIEAIKLETIAMEIFKKVFGEEHPDYVMSLNNIAYYDFCIGNYNEAIRLETIAMEEWMKVLGKEHPNYATSLCHLANFNLTVGNYDDAAKYYHQFYERTTAYVLKNFALMTSNERTNFWNTCYEFLYRRSDFFSKDLPYIAYKINNADINALAYNGQVFSKGLLLNAELELQKLIEHSNDTTFENRYYKIKQDRAKLDELYQLSPDERSMDADSLSKVIEDEERLLVQSSKELGDYTKNLSIDWHDIQKNLKDNDLAVEFANFKDTSTKQKIYVALVLKKGMKSPELVKLFISDDFYEIFDSEYYRTSKLYNLVWKPLEEYLDGVKNVYFSPCGKFHTIGIEYLPDESGKIFAEKFNAYRLSSTRELALSKEINPNKKAATYGGIKYGEDNNGTGKRGVATYLKGSKIESDTVAKLLQSEDYEVIALSDTIATEESFKKLSGTNLKILHIGTHGFYYSESDLENAGFSFFSNNNQQSEEDKALSCSGLLFAGANFALERENRNALPEGDDGILTAKEISRLDFKGLDLVVLSACQTGLGEVTGEGVFGLQRGFKKAGAQTIVMSLWEVDDYATRLLMTEFFKGLTLGKSKREAFLSALDFVKAKNSDPKYWAAFVMVDGME